MGSDDHEQQAGIRYEVEIDGDEPLPDALSDEGSHLAVTTSGGAKWLDVYQDGDDPAENRPIWSGTPEECRFEVPHDIFERYFQPGDTATIVAGAHDRKAIPFWQIRRAVEDAPEDSEYAVLRSDGDRAFAEDLAEANHERRRFQESIDFLAPGTGHTVQMVDLTEEPPEQ